MVEGRQGVGAEVKSLPHPGNHVLLSTAHGPPASSTTLAVLSIARLPGIVLALLSCPLVPVGLQISFNHILLMPLTLTTTE
jgi:hypothetical protein